MDPLQRRTVAAAFATRGQAESALHELWHTGFSREQIGLAVPGRGVEEVEPVTGSTEENAAKGAVAGAVTGGTIGAVLGALATFFIPGVGPILAGGILATAFTGAAAGAATGSLIGPFVAMEMSEDEARSFENAFRLGRTVLVVRAGDRAEEALTILRTHGGKDTFPTALQTAAG